jgi:hypothetical protein
MDGLGRLLRDSKISKRTPKTESKFIESTHPPSGVGISPPGLGVVVITKKRVSKETKDYVKFGKDEDGDFIEIVTSHKPNMFGHTHTGISVDNDTQQKIKEII